MVGRRVGGTIAFGGGLALYSGRDLVGGIAAAFSPIPLEKTTALSPPSAAASEPISRPMR
jgi:hypothetical protein